MVKWNKSQIFYLFLLTFVSIFVLFKFNFPTYVVVKTILRKRITGIQSPHMRKTKSDIYILIIFIPNLYKLILALQCIFFLYTANSHLVHLSWSNSQINISFWIIYTIQYARILSYTIFMILIYTRKVFKNIESFAVLN